MITVGTTGLDGGQHAKPQHQNHSNGKTVNSFDKLTGDFESDAQRASTASTFESDAQRASTASTFESDVQRASTASTFYKRYHCRPSLWRYFHKLQRTFARYFALDIIFESHTKPPKNVLLKKRLLQHSNNYFKPKPNPMLASLEHRDHHWRHANRWGSSYERWGHLLALLQSLTLLLVRHSLETSLDLCHGAAGVTLLAL